MSKWRTTVKQARFISGFLIVALVFLTILPSHFHLHHVEADSHHDSHDHGHMVDVHLINASLDASHPQDAQLLKTSPDGIINKLDIKSSPFLFFVLLIGLVVLTLNNSGFNPNRQHLIRRRLYYHYYPPLRGPPQ